MLLLLLHPPYFTHTTHPHHPPTTQQFPEAIEDMLEELTPNRLTDYLYSLSDTFNGFYTECKVLGSDAEDSRLLLVEATARVMRQCFSLLGITPLYRI
jgi:arginyl-tRNA synthetase